jgi:hypothetical protein
VIFRQIYFSQNFSTRSEWSFGKICGYSSDSFAEIGSILTKMASTSGPRQAGISEQEFDYVILNRLCALRLA